MAEFLFEIGLEEVPARMIAGAAGGVGSSAWWRCWSGSGWWRLGLASKSFSTPRRLAVLGGGCAARQEDVAEELMGPSVKIAFKDGVATPAAVAFAKKAGVAVDGAEDGDDGEG